MFSYCGRCSYSTGLAVQERVFAEALTGGLGHVLGFEFDPVITLGRRSVAEQDLLAPLKNFEIVHVDRGGEATLHNPGQLVIYPVVSLRRLQISVADFVESLALITQKSLQHFRVQALPRPGEPGLYTESGKIAFFGLRVRRGIVTHGLSINLQNDLSSFQSIRSCGVRRAALDSLQNHGIDVQLERFFNIWSSHAKRVWGLDDVRAAQLPCLVHSVADGI